MSGNLCCCSSSAGGSDGGGGALVGGSKSMTTSGICGNMIVMKEWMISPIAGLRREK